MNEIAKLIVTLVSVFSLVGGITFYLNIMSNVARISQGDSNATKDVTDSIVDETTSQLEWSIGIYILIAFASVLGLGSVVTILKKLR